MIAQRFYGKRSALIGDAAVGMHPVTAHGFNLGLASADLWPNWFSKPSNAVRILVRRACWKNTVPSTMLHAHPIYHGTNMLLKLFTNENCSGETAARFGIACKQ